jgi:hypothetical protein
MVEFKTYINLLPHLQGMHYLEVPQEVVQALGGKLKLRLHCTVNKTITFQCGLMALGQGSAYISISKERMKALGLSCGSKADVLLKKDDSKYGTTVPEEFEELLRQDDEGARRFGLLTPGKQRYVINHVAAVKSTQLRINRSITLIENLKQLPEGKEEFRAILGLPPR